MKIETEIKGLGPGGGTHEKGTPQGFADPTGTRKKNYFIRPI